MKIFRIGIIGAMYEEIKYFKKFLNYFKKENFLDIKFIIGNLNNKKIIIVQSGIGKVLSSITTTILILKYNIDFIINIGTAGSLNNNIKINDIIIGEKISYFDVNLSSFGYNIGKLPSLPLYFKSNINIINKLIYIMKNIIKINNFIKGLIVTGDTFIDNFIKKKSILKNFPKAIACEMESASIASVAFKFKIPFLILRIISDCSDKNSKNNFKNYINYINIKLVKIIIKLIQKLE